MPNNNFLVSIIIPVYNEEKNIAPLLKSLLSVIKPYSYEVIFIDDGSTDNTSSEIKKAAGKNANIKLISFMRNFGHQVALLAGYKSASGNCVVSMDADLQDPPEVISQMIKKWQEGIPIVYARREERAVDGYFKRASAAFFYWFINFLSDTPIPTDVGDFRLLDREVVDYLNSLPEQSLFLRGLVAWSGYPSATVDFKREKRFSGQTHYSFSKMVNFAMEGITSFSIKPLRLVALLGFLTSLFSVLVIIFKSVQHFIFNRGDWLPGWASLFFSILFLGGVQLIAIGMIGEYIGKVFKETQKRPRYLIKERVNFQ